MFLTQQPGDRLSLLFDRLWLQLQSVPRTGIAVVIFMMAFLCIFGGKSGNLVEAFNKLMFV
jgi:hypothetical protein